MKISAVASLIALVGCCLWFVGSVPLTQAKDLQIDSCGCAQVTDLQNRLKAVNAAIASLEEQQSAERWQAAFSQSSYQNDLLPIIAKALQTSGAGTSARIRGEIDPASCAIRPQSPTANACFAELIATSTENKRESCEAWKSDPNRTGADYRTTNSMSDVISEELTSYYAEQGFLQEKLMSLQLLCGNRRGANPVPPGIPIPTGTGPGSVPPSRQPGAPPSGSSGRPSGVPSPVPSPAASPGGVPIGVPPGGPPTGGPPVQPPPIPQSSPPPSQPPGSGGPIGVRRRSGYVRYILDGTMSFPGLGTFKLTSDSNIPFSITQNRVTGGGTITTIFDTSGSNCKVSNYDATVDVDVAGTRVGNTLNVLVTRRASGSGPSFADKVASVRMECFIGGEQAFAQMIPNPMSNVTPGVRQRLQLPRPGQPYSEIQTPIGYGLSGPAGPMGLTGTITLRVYSP